MHGSEGGESESSSRPLSRKGKFRLFAEPSILKRPALFLRNVYTIWIAVETPALFLRNVYTIWIAVETPALGMGIAGPNIIWYSLILKLILDEYEEINDGSVGIIF
jgi:hypothetical protein